MYCAIEGRTLVENLQPHEEGLQGVSEVADRESQRPAAREGAENVVHDDNGRHRRL
jgi:hypothetical protein